MIDLKPCPFCGGTAHLTTHTNWKQFGETAERLCKKLGLNHYIKESLRKEMEADNE